MCYKVSDKKAIFLVVYDTTNSAYEKGCSRRPGRSYISRVICSVKLRNKIVTIELASKYLYTGKLLNLKNILPPLTSQPELQVAIVRSCNDKGFLAFLPFPI